MKTSTNMKPDRKDILMNNLLSEICKTAEMPKDVYIQWLKSEVGMSDAEILHLKNANCFPMPV